MPNDERENLNFLRRNRKLLVNLEKRIKYIVLLGKEIHEIRD